MPVLDLIEPVVVHIQRLNRSVPIQDEHAREPLFGDDRNATTFQVAAQVKWLDMNQQQLQPGGLREAARGYIVVKEFDGSILKVGDRITRIGTVLTSAYLIESEPFGHWWDINGPGHRKWYFADRAPKDPGA